MRISILVVSCSARGFASWLYGDEALLAFVYGDAKAAAKLREYYVGVFGPHE
jgi:hypothetical protein